MNAFAAGAMWVGVAVVVSMFGHACYQTWQDSKIDGRGVERRVAPAGVAHGPSEPQLLPPVVAPCPEEGAP